MLGAVHGDHGASGQREGGWDPPPPFQDVAVPVGQPGGRLSSLGPGNDRGRLQLPTDGPAAGQREDDDNAIWCGIMIRPCL